MTFSFCSTVLVLFFLTWSGLLSPGQGTPPSLPSWNSAAQNAWWAQNTSPDRWPKAIGDLTVQLTADYKQNGASCFSNSDFQGWLEHLEWMRLGVACANDLTDDNDFKAFVMLGKDETISHLFVEKLDAGDDKEQALAILLKLARSNLDDLHEYAALGVAYALVFDQPFPQDWPHAQVPQEAVPVGDLDVVQRFNFYVQANRNHKTDLDLAQLTFENLKFLVDSRVKLSELEYAEQNRISLSHFDDAFFAIKYDTNRVSDANTAFVWSYPTYTLADIEQNGGICVDQAYYASMLGKGRGIPTLYFHGQGTDGGHAWFGYLGRSGRWNLDCGRYESQNYPKGYALDPQTWQVIDDTELTNFFKNGDTNSNFQPAENAIAWARLQEDDAARVKILDDARTIMPELAQTWKIEAPMLEKSGANDDDRKTFYQSWIAQFTSFPDMKVEGQRLLLQVLQKSGDPAAHDLEQDIVLENRSGSFDQGIAGASTVIEDKIKAADWDGARLEYEKTIRDFGEQGGGTLFYEVISPYVNACLKEGRVDQAGLGISFAEDRMSIDAGSIVGMEMARLKGEAHDRKMAAPP